MYEGVEKLSRGGVHETWSEIDGVATSVCGGVGVKQAGHQGLRSITCGVIERLMKSTVSSLPREVGSERPRRNLKTSTARRLATVPTAKTTFSGMVVIDLECSSMNDS